MEEAAEGSSALRKAEKNRPALVLTDIQMPGMNGIELVHSIRSHKELRDIPILVMTAFDPSLLAEALANGANDTIQKPIQLTSLFETCSRIEDNARVTADENGADAQHRRILVVTAPQPNPQSGRENAHG